MTRSSVRAFVLAISSLFLTTSAVAQVTTATLYGLVRDPSGSMLPGATVTMTQEETGAVRTTTTNGSGEFAVSAVPVGTYEVKIELQGFKAHVRRGVQLASGQTMRESFELELGAVSENVTVEGVAALVKTASSEQMETLGKMQVSELPLSRRNITGLLRLAPGVDPTGGHRGVRFNGVGKHGAGITVDGTDANSNPEGRGISQYGGDRDATARAAAGESRHVQYAQSCELRRAGDEHPVGVLRSDSQRRIAAHDPGRRAVHVLATAQDSWLMAHGSCWLMTHDSCLMLTNGSRV